MLRITLAAAAIFAIAACGSDKKKDFVDKASVPAVQPQTVSTTETVSTGTAVITPVPPGVSFDMGDAAFREKRYGDAVRLFNSYVEQRPKNAWGHYMLGLSAWKSGDLDVARSSFERAIELDPKHVKSRLNIGRVLLDKEEPGEARKHVSVALTIDSTSSEGHRLMGRINSALKQHDEAILSYRTALSYDPGDVWSLNNMALIMIQQQRYDEALPPLARAVQIDSTVPVIQNNLGIVLEHTGHYALASKAYRSAIAADPGYTKAVTSLSRVDGRKEDPTLVPVDLVAIAKAFDDEVRMALVVRKGGEK